ncbi:MAG: hypothetical protein MMC33_005734 [Icmadophila ericetorum]|nr:hypothetical protein [Icmadophila ericetorum]
MGSSTCKNQQTSHEATIIVTAATQTIISNQSGEKATQTTVQEEKPKKKKMSRFFGVPLLERNWPKIIHSPFHPRQTPKPEPSSQAQRTSKKPSRPAKLSRLESAHWEVEQQKDLEQRLLEARQRIAETEKWWISSNAWIGQGVKNGARWMIEKDCECGKEARRELRRRRGVDLERAQARAIMEKGRKREKLKAEWEREKLKRDKVKKEKLKKEEKKQNKKQKKGRWSKREIIKFLLESAPK